MADNDGVMVNGPDGKQYSFPAGTTQDKAIAYFRSKGIGAPAKPTPSSGAPGTDVRNMLWQPDPRTAGNPAYAYPQQQKSIGQSFAPSNILSNFYEGARGLAKGTYDIGKDLVRNPNWLSGKDSTAEKFVYKPAEAEQAKAKQLYSQGRLSEAAGHGLASVVPFVGPWAASLGEQAGRGDVGGAVSQIAGAAGASKVGGLVVDSVTGMVDPVSLRKRAAELNTKVLRTADPKARDYGLGVGLQVAKEQIIGSLRSLPQKIEMKRMAKDIEVKQIIQAADQAGTTIDVSQGLGRIINDTTTLLAQRGQWTPQVRKSMTSLLTAISKTADPRTGQIVPRDLTRMKLSEAWQLQKGLENLSGFGKDTPTAINHFASAVRMVIGDEMGKASPRLQKLRMEESQLVKARDAAKDNLASTLNDNRRAMKGVLYSGVGTLGAYIALKTLGAGWMGSVAGVVLLSAMARSATSRTLRAALYARAADLIDSPKQANAGPTGPSGAPAPGSAMQGPRPPQVPPAQGLTAGAGAAPPPFAPSQVVSTNPPPAASAPRAASPALPADVVEPPRRSGVQSTTTTAAPKTAPSPETSVRNKAMLDRLDTILNTKPTSGAHADALKREAAEIKKLLAGEATGKVELGGRKRSEAGAIARRASQRESLATKRAAEKATGPEAVVAATQAGSVGMAKSPQETLDAAQREQLLNSREALLNAGYAKLATYEDGQTMVDALRKQAKELQGTDYNEIEQLTQALKVMQEITGK